jgi:carnitine-CoA ligase
MTHQVYNEMKPTFAEQRDWTLPQVLRARAASHAEDVYLEVPEEGKTYTFARTLDLAERIATTLLGHAEFGDRVLLMAPNSAPFVLSWFGAAIAGMIEVPINTAYSGRFLEHQVKVAGPRIAVIDAAYAERFVASREVCAVIQRFYVLGEAAEVKEACEQLSAHGWTAAPWDHIVADTSQTTLPDVRHLDPVGILFTSGTTGPSKGVTMSHAHMFFFADQCVSLTRLTDSDTYLVMGPLFHGNAQFLAAYPALIAGARFVLHERFSASRWIDRIRDSRATVTNFVGVMMDFVWKQPQRGDDADNHLRCVFAAPTAPYVDEFRERFGIEAFVEVFGLTETSMPILSPYGQPRPTGAAGLLDATHFDVRLVDPETDEEVPEGEMGELVVRPRLPWITTLGYYGMPDRTVEAFRNLWFHTGDGMRRDADGWFYFVDRLKDALC